MLKPTPGRKCEGSFSVASQLRPDSWVCSGCTLKELRPRSQYSTLSLAHNCTPITEKSKRTHEKFHMTVFFPWQESEYFWAMHKLHRPRLLRPNRQARVRRKMKILQREMSPNFRAGSKFHFLAAKSSSVTSLQYPRFLKIVERNLQLSKNFPFLCKSELVNSSKIGYLGHMEDFITLMEKFSWFEKKVRTRPAGVMNALNFFLCSIRNVYLIQIWNDFFLHDRLFYSITKAFLFLYRLTDKKH